MREILFRGKRIDNGEWVEGVIVVWDEEYYIAPAIINRYISMGGRGKGRRRLFGDYYHVDPSTVGQYTGLTDKNGKRIFEGDIVFNNMTGRKLIGYLEERAAFCFCDKCITSPAFIGQYNFEYFEVIGNVHDNPELLEVRK